MSGRCVWQLRNIVLAVLWLSCTRRGAHGRLTVTASVGASAPNRSELAPSVCLTDLTRGVHAHIVDAFVEENLKLLLDKKQNAKYSIPTTTFPMKTGIMTTVNERKKASDVWNSEIPRQKSKPPIRLLYNNDAELATRTLSYSEGQRPTTPRDQRTEAETLSETSTKVSPRSTWPPSRPVKTAHDVDSNNSNSSSTTVSSQYEVNTPVENGDGMLNATTPSPEEYNKILTATEYIAFKWYIYVGIAGGVLVLVFVVLVSLRCWTLRRFKCKYDAGRNRIPIPDDYREMKLTKWRRNETETSV